MSDSEIGPGGPLPPLPNIYNPIAAVGFPNVGTPVAIRASDGQAVPANATAPGTLRSNVERIENGTPAEVTGP